MRKKGQITMESLLLYGAAILVVLLAIAALTYFGVLDLGRLLPDKCNLEGTGSLKCNDYTIADTGVIQVEVINKGVKAFEITGGNFLSDDKGLADSCPIASPPTVPPGGTSILTFNCGTFTAGSGTRLSGKIELDYTLGGSLAHKGYGTLTATVS